MLIKIPLELKTNFLRDPENFIRDIACISTQSTRPFFKRKKKVEEAEKIKPRINPFNDETMSFDEDWKCQDGDIHNRYMHIDLGIKKDAVGIAMSHAPFFVEREEIDMKSGSDNKLLNVRLPFIHFDFLGRIKANKGDEILLSSIRQIIYEISRRGFYLNLVTYDGFQCFSGDTEIALLDGRSLSFYELVKEYGRKGKFWVYAFDHKTQRIIPAKATAARKTGINAPTLKVYLDNGEIIKCTKDHLFMDREGNYTKAKDLIINQTLMPFKTKQLKSSKTNKLRKYKRIYQPIKKSWEYIHRIVAGDVPEGFQVHHSDRNPYNNAPENLEIVTALEHLLLHRDSPSYKFLTYWAAVEKNPEMKKLVKEVRSIAMKKRWKDPEQRKVLLRVLQRAVESSCSKESRLKRSKSMLGNDNGKFNKGKSHTAFTRQVLSSKSIELWQDPVYRKKMESKDRQKGIRGKKWKIEDDKRVYYNHKVIKIEEGVCQDVYDIEVPGYSNFALASGIFVHNSVDSIQILKSQGYKVSRLSIDRTATKILLDKHAKDGSGLKRISTEGQVLASMQTLKDALYDDRFSIPYHPYWLIEAGGAEIDYKKQKVDHKPRGSIDLLQAMAGSAYDLVNNEFEYLETEEGLGKDGDNFYGDLPQTNDDYLYSEEQIGEDQWERNL